MMMRNATAATALVALFACGAVAPASASPYVALSTLGGTVTGWGINDDCTYPLTSGGAGSCGGTPTYQSMGLSFNFFGTTYSNTYINNNGNITFSSPLSAFTPAGLTTGSTQPMIAPFWGDVDTRGGGSAVVDFTTGATYAGRTAFGVEWPGVGYYNARTDKLNKFELIIVDRSDTGAGNADIYFNYDSIQWETGDASGGSFGLGGSCAQAGFSNGAATPTYFTIPGSGVCGSFLDGSASALNATSNDSNPGQWLFQVRNGEVVVPPQTEAPEPMTLALLGLGLAGLGVARRRAR